MTIHALSHASFIDFSHFTLERADVIPSCLAWVAIIDILTVSDIADIFMLVLL